MVRQILTTIVYNLDVSQNYGLKTERRQKMDNNIDETPVENAGENAVKKYGVPSEAGRRIKTLFWIYLISLILDTGTVICRNLQTSYFIIKGAYIFFTAVYGIVLLGMASENRNYKKAGIFALVTTAVSVLTTFVFPDKGIGALYMIMLFGGAVIGILRDYNEYTAHSRLVYKKNPVLSDKWYGLWRKYIILMAIMLVSAILIFILPWLDVVMFLVFLAGFIGVIALEVLKIVYLHRTAELFNAGENISP